MLFSVSNCRFMSEWVGESDTETPHPVNSADPAHKTHGRTWPCWRVFAITAGWTGGGRVEAEETVKTKQANCCNIKPTNLLGCVEADGGFVWPTCWILRHLDAVLTTPQLRIQTRTCCFPEGEIKRDLQPRIQEVKLVISHFNVLKFCLNGNLWCVFLCFFCLLSCKIQQDPAEKATERYNPELNLPD